MVDNLVTIRGTSDGLIIDVGPGDLADILRELDGKLGQSANFFRGGRVALRVGSHRLEQDDLQAVGAALFRWGVTLWAVESTVPETRLAAEAMGLEISLDGGRRTFVERRPATDDLAPDDGEEPAGPEPGEAAEAAAATPATQGLLLKRTLRSGASLVHRGHVVIIGDVNPGAEVIAGGDIVVWGKLRGLAHAGAGGDETAVVCALRLNPAQLRIATRVAVRPREARTPYPAPQVASLREGDIVLEPWLESALAVGTGEPRGLGRVLRRIGDALRG